MALSCGQPKYSSFGKASIEVETVENNLRFPGQYYDLETGLYYNLHRNYDPATGRYLTPDPIGLEGGVNLYAYVLNNPIMREDPFGLECKECPGGEWEGSSFLGIALFWGGGVTIDRVFWSCKASNVTCEAVYFCFGGGLAGEASVDLAGTAKATGAYKSGDLAGWSTGYRAAGPVSIGGLSETRTKSLYNEAKIKHTSGGLGGIGGITKITCMTLSTTCK